SSLSACTQALAAADAGYLRLAFDYAAEAALVDLHDLYRNTRDGLHMASLAGTWIALVMGFGGLRDYGDVLAFARRLPDGLPRLQFSILPRSRCRRVEVTAQPAGYPLVTRARDALRVKHHGELLLVAEEPVVRPIPPAQDRKPPMQPPGRAPKQR